MKKKIIVIAAFCIALLASVLIGGIVLHASSPNGCLSKGKEINNGRCVNDGKNFFCASLSGEDCFKGIYPGEVVTQ